MEIVGGQTKVCNKCGKEKFLDQFSPDKRSPDGRKYDCKKCRSKLQSGRRKRNPDDMRRRDRGTYYKHHAANVAKLRSDEHFGKHLQKKFGLSLDTYKSMVAMQGGCCAICLEPPTHTEFGNKKKTRLHVDHNHDTGVIRGLLCHGCNIALGMLKDDPIRVLKAYEYLTRQG